MIELGGLVFGLTGQADPQPAEAVLVGLRENDRGVGLAAPELLQLLHRPLGVGVGDRADGQGHQQLVDMQAGILVARTLTFRSWTGSITEGEIS